MIRVNLLPWREEKRREQDRQMVSVTIMLAILSSMVVFLGYRYVDGMHDNQVKRNQYLYEEIGKLDEKIKETQALQAEKDSLVSRMEVIQDLQQERIQVVHFFDDIVRKLPEGVYYNGLQKRGDKFQLTGTAQSNARVSELMNRLDASDWFENPDLSVINVTPTEGIRLSQFELTVSEQRVRSTEAAN